MRVPCLSSTTVKFNNLPNHGDLSFMSSQAVRHKSIFSAISGGRSNASWNLIDMLHLISKNEEINCPTMQARWLYTKFFDCCPWPLFGYLKNSYVSWTLSESVRGHQIFCQLIDATTIRPSSIDNIVWVLDAWEKTLKRSPELNVMVAQYRTSPSVVALL